MADATLLVTGGAGFTGRHLIEAANQKGYRCIAMVQHEVPEAPAAFDTVVADLLDPASLEHAILEVDPDYIVHLAAISFVAHGNTAEIYQVNQLGTINLLDAIRKNAPEIKKVLIASSANIYGNTAALPITESVPPAPVNHYGMSKVAMELATRLYEDLPIVLSRPFNYTGRGQSPNFLIPKIVNAFKAGKRAIELGNLNVSRDFSDVRDVVSAYLSLLETDVAAPAYNVCSGTPTSLLSVIDTLNDLAGYDIRVSINPDFIRSDEIKTLYGSPALLEGAIGSYRNYALRDTLAWMLAEK
ncbi:GDP-mannose 4,6-dehydratase [Luminiphilus sp.]|nr:GDP-mannose 4,6-dehydratase [Luminiphilus sp.]MDA8677591.1 GDP-mannose 4,6-dehydratase [Luminiphilus sp.]